MISSKWKIFLFLLAILSILFGIGSGIYYQFSDNNMGNEDNSTNWKKGFSRLALILSIIVGILGGAFFANLAKKGKLADGDDGDPPPKYFTDLKSVFLIYFFFSFGFVWLIYFIIQWPVYYFFIFVLRGFTS